MVRRLAPRVARLVESRAGRVRIAADVKHVIIRGRRTPLQSNPFQSGDPAHIIGSPSVRRIRPVLADDQPIALAGLEALFRQESYRGGVTRSWPKVKVPSWTVEGDGW
jgi:hypothetical protein